MKGKLIGLIVLALIVINGSAIAWDVDVNIAVEDTSVDLTATATTDNYLLSSAAGVDGTGLISIHGEGDAESGQMMTSVSGTGAMYAANGLGAVGLLEECSEGDCDDCNYYEYDGVSYAEINGQGKIILAEVVGYDTDEKNIHAQFLFANGIGDFTAGMMTSFWDSETNESVSHAMGTYGYGVKFSAFGMNGMDTGNGEGAGWFTSNMRFIDEGCEEEADCDNPVTDELE